MSVAKQASGVSPQQRRKARHYGMQALYRWQVNGGTPAEIEAEFRSEYDLGVADIDYFRGILEGVIYHQPDIDAALVTCLDRDISELTPVELALLRQAVYVDVCNTTQGNRCADFLEQTILLVDQGLGKPAANSTKSNHSYAYFFHIMSAIVEG